MPVGLQLVTQHRVQGLGSALVWCRDIACYLLEGKNKLYVQVIGSSIYRENWGGLCNQEIGF